MTQQPDRPDVLLRKAKADQAVLDLTFNLPGIHDEIFGFHAQQAAEKGFKAILAHKGIPFPRIHNVKVLMDMVTDAGFQISPEVADLDQLTPYGTLARYEEGDPISPLDRGVIRKKIETLLNWVEAKIK